MSQLILQHWKIMSIYLLLKESFSWKLWTGINNGYFMYLATSVTTFSMLSVYLPQELGAQFVSRSSILRLENSCSIFPSENTRKKCPFWISLIIFPCSGKIFYLTSLSDAATFMQGVPFPSSYEAWAKSYFLQLMWTWTLKSKHPLTYLPDTAG